MNFRRAMVVVLIITGILANGCRTPNPLDHGGRLLVEYRPGYNFTARAAVLLLLAGGAGAACLPRLRFLFLRHIQRSKLIS